MSVALTDTTALDRILDRCIQQGDCWLWTGATSAEGYGRVRHDGTVQPVHRVVYELAVGPIPEGLTIDHVRERGCISRLCCNWQHMEPVPLRVNGQRGRAVQTTDPTTCQRGHEFTLANTRITKRGTRQCRECTRLRARMYDQGLRMRT